MIGYLSKHLKKKGASLRVLCVWGGGTRGRQFQKEGIATIKGERLVFKEVIGWDVREKIVENEVGSVTEGPIIQGLVNHGKDLTF